MRFHQTDLIFGLDRQKSAVQTICLDPVQWLQQPIAYLETTDADLPTGIASQIHDYSWYPRFEQLDQLPLDQSGQIDKLKLQSLTKDRQSRNQPQTPTEETLAVIWKDVLGVSTIDRQDNFFELGGTSVLAARLFIQIEQSLGVASTVSYVVSSTNHCTAWAYAGARSERSIALVFPRSNSYPVVLNLLFSWCMPVLVT